MKEQNHPNVIKIRNAHVHNLKHIDVDIPPNKIVGIAGVSGSGNPELLNTLRLMFSRLADHIFLHHQRKKLSFNSQGACQTCGGTGFVRKVDESSLVPDESLSIDEGAVLPWKTLMWSLMTDVYREMGVRTDVPFHELTKEEKEIVYHGPAEKSIYSSGSSIASAFNAQSEPGVVFQFFSAFRQSMRSI